MPKIVDAGAQRKKIADAAISVVSANGLEGARLRDVARAAKVTTGAVMHYFDGKEEVLEAALEEVVRRIVLRMNSSPSSSFSWEVDAFVERVAGYLPLDETGREEWRVWLAFWGRAVANDRLREIHRQYYEEIVHQLMSRLNRLRGSQFPLPLEGTRCCADALIAALDGIGTRATLEPTLWPAERQRRTLGCLLGPMLEQFVLASESL